jgi:signal transduction histidine kinase
VGNFHQPGKERFQALIRTLRRLFLFLRRLLSEQLNRNIYTRILFTNATLFVIALLVLLTYTNFIVRQVAYDQVQQELLRKAKRVNFALLQQTAPVWDKPLSEIPDNQAQSRQDLLKFLSDAFDARITVFDTAGTILGVSAEQEVLPGSKVEPQYIEVLGKGETTITRKVDRETGQFYFIAAVPMGNNLDPVKNGILLEMKPANLDLTLSQTRLYLLLGGMVLLVIIIIVSVYLAMHISRPISRLAATVAEISRGSYIVSSDDHHLDEISDLTGQLNKMSLRLQKMQADNDRMEEERARLFAEISHELRTPLTAVQGFVEAIRDGMVKDEAVMERYLDTIYAQTLHIARLVDDILALNRLESGNVTVEKMPVDLTVLAQGVAMSMEGVAQRQNTSIQLEKKTKEAVVIGDIDRLEQILRNLLKNAIEATKNGIIKIAVEKGQSEVLLTITDNGCGIPPEELPHIWDRFYRVKNKRGSFPQEKGIGLGLVIVKKLIQLQDGKIDVTSQLGKGTTFSLSFPARP